MQLFPIGKGGDSLPGTTAGQLHENGFSSTILGMTVLTGQTRTSQTQSTKESKTDQYKNGCNLQRTFLLSKFIITHLAHLLRTQRRSRRHSPYIYTSSYISRLPSVVAILLCISSKTIMQSTQSTQSTTMVPFTITSRSPGMLSNPHDPDLYRIRVQPTNYITREPVIKYLTAPNTSQVFPGLYAQARRRNVFAFDKVPTGDWVVGRLAPTESGTDENDGKLELVSTESDTKAALDGLGMRSAEPVFRETIVDEQDCKETPDNPRWTTMVNAGGKQFSLDKPKDLQCMDYTDAVVIATPPGVPTDAKEVICVTEWMPGHFQGIEADARAHETIQAGDPDLVPRLVAHVTENHGRVFGFLLERVPGAREAGAAELDACRAVLERLHALGIAKSAKGQLSRHSFLVREDGSVMLQGPFTGNFGSAEQTEENMRAEMESLEHVLARSPSVFEEQEEALLKLIDPRRVKLLEEFERAHGLIVPFVYWQESEKGGGRIMLTVEQHGELAEKYRQNGFGWTDELQKQAEKRFCPSVEAS